MGYLIGEELEDNFRFKLDDLNRRFPYKSKRSITYLRSLNEVILQLHETPSSLLGSMTSHPFYRTLRHLTTALLIHWHSSFVFNPDEVFLLRNCVAFLTRLVKSVKDLTLLSSWFSNRSLINAIADCMNSIVQLISMEEGKDNFKQLTRLFDLFSRYYRQLSEDYQDDSRYDRLFEATMNCLTSSKYDRVFRRIKVQEKSLQIEEKFFLVQCPAFLISKHSSTPSTSILEQLLGTMIPRYAAMLDKHIKSIDQWNSGIIHAVHHLLLTVVLLRGHYTNYAHGQPLRWLIDDIIRIISQPSIVNEMKEDFMNYQSLVIDSSLKVLTGFVRDPDLLIYIKQLKIQSILRSLISSPCESIAFHSYLILSYIMDEVDIKSSEKESGRLLSNIFDSLRREIRLLSERNEHDQSIEHNITLLVEAIQVLVQHDQIKSEILKQNALPLLMNNIRHINRTSQRLLLESLGSLTFDEEAAKVLRENTQFLDSVKEIQSSTDNGIRKAAEKIIWNLINEPEKLKKVSADQREKPTKDEFEYDIMISYCHADKELVHKIHRYLADHGFKIWIDQEQIYGPAMQAMAEAVEKSEFVILCMSDSYKRSVYCQAEAEYAFRCQRRLLPLIVREEYRPDGWLGLLLGSRIYINFGRFDFKTGCEALLNEITLHKKSQLHSDKEDEQSIPEVDSTKVHQLEQYINRNTSDSIYRSTPVRKWTHKDVLDFLHDCKLYLMMPLCEALNGRGLEKLFRICQKKPTKLHEQLNEELGSSLDERLPMGVFTQFLSEVEQMCQLKVIKSGLNTSGISRSLSSRSHRNLN